MKSNKLNLAYLEDSSIDNIEIALDGLLKDSIMKEIPVLKTVVALFKTGKSVKDYLLIRKIYTFMESIQDIPQDKIDKFINKIDNPKKINEFGMKILQIIDRLDDVKKAELIGKLFKMLLQQEINQSMHFRICYIIDKCYYDDILQLIYYKENETLTAENPHVHREVLENLFSSGLLSNHGIDGGNFDNNYGGTIYKLNDYGKIIAKLI